MTTPREMARLMGLIAEGKAVSRAASEAMLATLVRQQDRAMIPRLLPADDRVRIGNKTGTDEEKHAQKDGVKRHVRADARSSPVRAFRRDCDLCAADRRLALDDRQRRANHRRARVEADLRPLFGVRP